MADPAIIAPTAGAMTLPAPVLASWFGVEVVEGVELLGGVVLLALELAELDPWLSEGVSVFEVLSLF